MASQPPMQQFPPQVPYPYFPPVNPIAGPAKVFGIIYAVLAVLSLFGTLALVALSATAAAGLRQQQVGAGVLFSVIAAFVFVLGVLQGATAFGLLARKSWGRVMLIVTAILSLLSIPIGTILGGLALYFFMRGNSEQDYARLVRGEV